VLPEVGANHSFLFDHLRLEYLSSEGINRLGDSIDYLQLTDDIWRGLIHRFKGLCDDDFRMHRFFVESVRRFESNMI
jgi:hypothetical protein